MTFWEWTKKYGWKAFLIGAIPIWIAGTVELLLK